MKMTLSGSLLFLAALSVVGCSKSVRSTGQPQNQDQLSSAPSQVTAPQPSLTPTPTISGSPTPSTSPAPSAYPSPSASSSPSATGDSIKAKYEVAVLNCNLDFPLEYDYRRVGIESLGSDSFTWDLIKDFADQKKFVLNAKTFRKDLIVNLNVESIDIERSISFQTEDGSSETLKNTPVIKGTFTYQSASPISFLRMKSAVLGTGSFSFYEGVETKLVDEYVGTALENASDEYGILLNCVFNTKLKTATISE